nr:putative ribonuclease H-like domain-containing protein [Tanacetum cinerariifolium]
MDLKWQMAMLTMRAMRFLQRTVRNLGANGTNAIGFDMSKAECYNCHRQCHFARECSYDWSFQANEESTNYALMAFTSSSSSRLSGSDSEVAPSSKAYTKAYATLQSHYDKLTVEIKMSQFDFLLYKSGLESVEARLVVYQQNENMFEDDIKLLKLNVMLKDNDIVELRKKFKKAKKERDELKLTLENFHTSSKNLSKLLESQITDKTGLGYDNQVFNSTVFHCDELNSSETDESVSTSTVYNRYKSGEGYHVVPPPYTRTFMPSKPDLVFHDAPTASETVPNVFNDEPSTTKPTKKLSQSNRPSAPIIKDWVFDSEDEYEGKPMPTQKAPSFVQTSEHVKPPRESVKTTCYYIPAPKHRNFHKTVTTVKVNKVNADKGNPQQALKDKGVIDNGCSRHMTGNISYLSNFEKINGGYVAFGRNLKDGKITGKGKIKIGKLDFDDIYFVKELKFYLFSVSQMCDKKNSVLFTDTECVVLSFDFKLPDENHVLLGVPKENNMYNVDLKNVVPLGDLTCLLAKATLYGSNLWHRRLDHINFKTMNKLVKGNLVRGLPSKVFENNHTCVACKKGKQHRASCKSKLHSCVNHPLQRLHMDLFGPTFVKSLNKKSYCLVVTDDYSRFSWVFFLATKDATSITLKTFITGIENQINHKVKIFRSDNGTEFKNHDLNQFCRMKGIKREFSVARTLQQNEIAERKNRTLIEVARTMLADSLLLILFWAEAVNTACYVQNRILVTKPHNKTPYELLLGRTPSIGFMRPFGCPVTIVNTLDPLGKPDEKADEGFLVGYSVSSKAFRVFNSRTRIVQETLHINFLENQPNVAGNGPTWLFDIDTLTQSMNYQQVAAGNRPNSSADPQNTNVDAAFDVKENETEVHVSLSSSDKTKKHDPKTKREAKREDTNMVTAASAPVTAVGPNSTNNTNNFNAADPSDNVVSLNFEIRGKSLFVDPSQYPDDPDMPALEDIIYSDDEEDVGAEADFSNLETSIIVSPILTTRVHKDHPVTQIIDYEELFAPVARIEDIRLFLAYASFMSFMVYQMDVKSAFLYETIKEEVNVCQPPGFENPDYPDKELCKAFEKLTKDKFQMSSMGELTFFLVLQVKQKDDGIFIGQDKYVAEILRKFGLTYSKSASTLINTEKPLLKDPDDEDVDVHIYRSMIGSLMYFTSSRPDIMFVVCACARFQVTPKVSHLHAVKRIFRYLKGKPHLGLWYPKDSSFNLVTYSDSDHVGASLDRKSTTGGCQFL